MNINLRQDAPDQTDSVDVNELSEAIEQFKTVSAQVLATEQKLKEFKAQEKYISEFVIPEIMEKQNLKTVKLKDGSELSVGDRFFASFKSDKKNEGIKWLRDNGLGDIVDNNITVTFGQGEDNKAMAYATLAKGQGYDPEQKVSVHAGTLRLTLEDFHSRGGKIPPELFNTFEKNQTNIKNKPKQ